MIGPSWAALLVRRPAWVLTIAFALMPFQFAILGEESVVKISIVDLIAVSLLLPLGIQFARAGRLRAGGTMLPLCVFLSLAMLSTTIAGFSADAVISVIRMGINTLLAVLIFANLGQRPIDRRRAFVAFVGGSTLLGVFVALGFISGGAQGAMYAMGLNKNFIGPVLGSGVCCAVVFLITGRPSRSGFAWLVIAVVVNSVALLLCLSRGSWIATTVALSIIFVANRSFGVMILSAVVGSILLALLLTQLDAKSADYAGDVSSDATSIKLRFDYMRMVEKEFDSSPIFGVGVGLRKRVEPHNVFILTAGEMGVIGVASLAVVFGSGLWLLWRAWGKTRDPIVLMAAGVFVISVIDGMMDVYWRRGVGFMAWAGIGMVTSMPRSQPVRVPPRLRPAVA